MPAESNPILLLSEYGTLNGGEYSLLTVIESLQQRGWAFVAGVPGSTPLERQLQSRGVTNLGWNVSADDGKLLDQTQRRQQIVGLLQQVKPCLVHCNSLSMSRLAGPVIADQGVPAVGYLRDILKLSRRAIDDLNQMTRLVAVSQATADWHVEQGLDRARVRVVYNGVDSTRFVPPASPPNPRLQMLADSFGVEAQDPVLLFVGQLGMRKGIDVALEAVNQLAERWQRLKFLVVGQRHSVKAEAVEYERSLHQRANRINLLLKRPGGAAVEFLGRRADIPDLMQLATILVHPARQEPLGRVLLEAAASGLPMVSTDVGGTREILPRDLHAELLVAADAPDSMASRVDALLEVPERRQELAAELRKLALDRFSVVRCAAALDDLYREVGGVG